MLEKSSEVEAQVDIRLKKLSRTMTESISSASEMQTHESN